MALNNVKSKEDISAYFISDKKSSEEFIDEYQQLEPENKEIIKNCIVAFYKEINYFLIMKYSKTYRSAPPPILSHDSLWKPVFRHGREIVGVLLIIATFLQDALPWFDNNPFLGKSSKFLLACFLVLIASFITGASLNLMIDTRNKLVLQSWNTKAIPKLKNNDSEFRLGYSLAKMLDHIILKLPELDHEERKDYRIRKL